jgi:hypothetical protein
MTVDAVAFGPYGAQVHVLALQQQVPLAAVGGLQAHQHVAARRTAQPSSRALQSQGGHRAAVHRQQFATRGDARGRGGGAIQRGDHHDALALATGAFA